MTKEYTIIVKNKDESVSLEETFTAEQVKKAVSTFLVIGFSELTIKAKEQTA